MISQINTGFFNALKVWATAWAANTAKVVGDIVRPTSYNSHLYVCTTVGTTHATTEPTWGTTNGGTTADNTVVWTCYDAKTYNTKSPQGSTVPYVTFGLETDRPIGTFADQQAMEDLTFWVNVFSSTSTAHISAIADLVLTALDNVSLTVTGYSSMKCVREFIGSLTWDMEMGIYQIPMRFRLWLDKS